MTTRNSSTLLILLHSNMEAVMFDIDDTLLSRDTSTPIPKVINLLYHCKALGYVIVIMTARPGFEYNRRYTELQLKQYEIPYDYLIFCDASEKTRIKNEMDLHFVLSVGDQPTDLGGSTYYINTSTGSSNLCT
jgi:hydroxymethylpyrimidine pyrophosphatase-like HAD family hydrolase